nr:3-hydroxyacyl-CoA dehydrogenase [Staphylococcus auricularis]
MNILITRGVKYMDIKNVVVAGGGVLGSQIAFQSSFHDFNVTVYDINDDALGKAKDRLSDLRKRYVEDLDTTQEKVDEAFNTIQYKSDIAEAAADADIVIEAIPEVVDIKKDFYKNLGESAPDKTIFATNSSTFKPSDYKDISGRPEKFLALHFANEIWLRNTGEVMRTPDTSDEIFDEVLDFAKAIGMVPLPIYREQPGYILNSLLVPFSGGAAYLLASETSDVKTIDKTWMRATHDEHGPFGMNDIVGTNTQLNIRKSRETDQDPEWAKNYTKILQDMVDSDKLGKVGGKGFYNYPNPEYTEDAFFDNTKDVENLTHDFKNIAVAGSGLTAAQVAVQVASGDFNVILYSESEDDIQTVKDHIETAKKAYKDYFDVDDDKVNAIAERINYHTNIADATQDVDLVIEAVADDKETKEHFYNKLSEVLNDDAYIVTSTATLRPSDFEDATGRSEKFAALRIVNSIWNSNVGQVMVAGQTTEDTFNKVLAFARDINLVVAPLHKEQPGYIVNRIMTPLIQAGAKLLVKEVADKETIDKTWMIGFHANQGPFAIMDMTGLDNALEILKPVAEASDDEEDQKVIQLLEDKVNNNELGLATGKGFYDYSDGKPYFKDDFLK